MIRIRAFSSALVTAFFLSLLVSPAVAQQVIELTGSQASVDGGCVAAVPATGGFDCSYDKTDPIGAGTAWQGPVLGGSYYAPNQGPYTTITPGASAPIGDPNKKRLALYQADPKTDPFASIVTLSNAAETDGPGCAATDKVGALLSLTAATRAFQGGPGQNGEETWADAAIRVPILLTTVTSATPDTPNAGDCTYIVASLGFPPLLDAQAPDPNGQTRYPVDAEGLNTYDDPTPPPPNSIGVFCGDDGKGYDDTAGNCGPDVLSVEVGFGNAPPNIPASEWSCQDNTNLATGPVVCGTQAPNPGACGFTGSHYCGGKNFLENVLIKVVQDSNGDITEGIIYVNDESRIFNVGPPSPLSNSWIGTVYEFTGACTNCSFVRNDNYTFLTTDTFPQVLPIGANDAGPPDGLQNPTTVTIVGPGQLPDMGGSAVINNSPGLITAVTATYTPSPVAAKVETFGYTASDGVATAADGLIGTVTITIQQDDPPTAPSGGPFFASNDPNSLRGVDTTQLTILVDIITELNAQGNDVVINNVTNGSKGTATAGSTTQLVYTPAAGFVEGQDTFDYTTTDTGNAGPNPSAPGTVTVELQNVSPSVSGGNGETDQGEATEVNFLFQLGNGTLNQHSITAANGANGSCLVTSTTATGADGTGLVRYTPGDDFAGTDSCVITIVDGDGNMDSATGTITIVVIEDTGVILFPGGSAIDPWSLLMLLGLPFIRRKRQMQKLLSMGAVVLLGLFFSGAQAAIYTIDTTVQDGTDGAGAVATQGMIFWFTQGVNGSSSQALYSLGAGPGYYCSGLTFPSPVTCTAAVKPENWVGGAVTYTGTVNDDLSSLTLSWTGQQGTGATIGFNTLFTNSISSGSYDETGTATGAFLCYNNPASVNTFGGADFCGNLSGGSAPSTGAIPQTIANKDLTDGLVAFTDNTDGTITIDLTNSTYSDCVADANCSPGSGSSNIFVQWTLNATAPAPDVTGLPIIVAEPILESAGFCLGNQKGKQSDTVDKGSIISQSAPRTEPNVNKQCTINGQLVDQLVDVIVATGAIQDFLPGGTNSLHPWSVLLLLGLPFMRRTRAWRKGGSAC